MASLILVLIFSVESFEVPLMIGLREGLPKARDPTWALALGYACAGTLMLVLGVILPGLVLRWASFGLIAAFSIVVVALLLAVGWPAESIGRPFGVHGLD